MPLKSAAPLMLSALLILALLYGKAKYCFPRSVFARQHARLWKLQRRYFYQIKDQDIMPKAKSHDEWLLLICGVCTRKMKDLRNITEDILSLIRKHHYNEYAFTWLPRKVCKGCLKIMKDLDSGITNRKLPIIDYESMQRPVPQTRRSLQCCCHFCQIGRISGRKVGVHSSDVRDKAGRPSSMNANDDQVGGSVKHCVKCKGVIAAGKSHDCNKRNLQENLFELVRESSFGTRQVVASKLLDSICEDKQVDKHSGTLVLKTQGTSKTINLGKPKKSKQFSTEDLLKLKINFEFSDKKILTLVATLRTVLGKSAVENGFQQVMQEKNNALTDFFMVKVLPTVRRKGTEETIEHRPGFFVKDIHALIHVLLEERQIDPEEQEILMGADDGQSSLKVSFRNYLFWEGLKKEKKVEFSTS